MNKQFAIFIVNLIGKPIVLYKNDMFFESEEEAERFIQKDNKRVELNLVLMILPIYLAG